MCAGEEDVCKCRFVHVFAAVKAQQVLKTLLLTTILTNVTIITIIAIIIITIRITIITTITTIATIMIISNITMRVVITNIANIAIATNTAIFNIIINTVLSPLLCKSKPSLHFLKRPGSLQSNGCFYIRKNIGHLSKGRS